MKILHFIVIFTLFYTVISDNKTQSRQNANKALSVFTVVRFPNEVCTSSTSGRNGTCYTASECTSRGGSSSGSCASSFGVCCVFEKSCGAGSISENCTYFTSSQRTTGSTCTLTVCKTGADVCQLRLDFETFTLTNPATRVATPAATAGGTYTSISYGGCETDFFTVSTPGATAPPLICGENSGQHIYVPASDQCNVLTSYFGTATTTTASAFTIKVTQVKCNSKRQAPENCLQYLTAATGQFETFNYQNNAGNHLANLDYCTCIRSDRTACTICYVTMDGAGAANVNNLGLGGAATGKVDYVDTWCGFGAGVVAGGATGAAATQQSAASALYDHITIPNSQCFVTTALPAGSTDDYISIDRYCGSNFNCVEKATTKQYTVAASAGTAHVPIGTVCSSTKPFQVCVKTDGVESQGADNAFLGDIELNAGNTAADTQNGARGFRMAYWQVSTCLLRN